MSGAGATHEMLLTTVAAVSVGTLLLVLARRVSLPALPLLVLAGAILGPNVLGIVRPQSLGDGLLVVVELAVGLILFEGGLALDREGYRDASAMIRRLLSVGVLVTWLGTALAIRLVATSDWGQAVIAAALVIVTGPTVVMPLLKRIRLAPRLHNILHWEAVLIEPIGVFIAVLCFEWLGEQRGAGALVNLALRLGIGTALGAGAGVAIVLAMRRSIVPRDAQGIFALACAVLTFGLAEAAISKAGLLAVTIAGFVVGLAGGAALRQLREFKAELTILLVGTLFILLAARLNADQFRDFGLAGAAAVAIVLLVVRPLSVALCAAGLDLTAREKTFLAWVAPRGIVAGSMASLFAISLEERGVPDARFMESFTYSMILATIVLQATTAGPLARLLGVDRPRPEGWLIVGAHDLAQRVASFIAGVVGERAILVDTNSRAVHEARTAGHTAINDDARDTELLERHGLAEVGHVMALTDNEDLNARICTAWSGRIGAERLFRYTTTRAAAPAEEVSGATIWYGLARPTLLSAEMRRGEASIQDCSAATELPGGAVLLATFDGRKVDLDPPLSPTAGRILYLRRRADYLSRAVRPDLVVTADRAVMRDLFEQMVGLMVSVHPELPRDRIVRELLEREAVFPSVIGEGVAVPHAYFKGLTQRLCGIARVSGGVEFPGGAGEPVRLVFLVLSPSGDPEGHLATLAEIARLVSSPEARGHLLRARSPQEIVHLVRWRGDSE